jgi:hypothetical protein
VSLAQHIGCCIENYNNSDNIEHSLKDEDAVDTYTITVSDFALPSTCENIFQYNFPVNVFQNNSLSSDNILNKIKMKLALQNGVALYLRTLQFYNNFYQLHFCKLNC